MFLSLTTLNSLRKILSLRGYFLEVVTIRCEEFIKLFRVLGPVRVFPLASKVQGLFLLLFIIEYKMLWIPGHTFLGFSLLAS